MYNVTIRKYALGSAALIMAMGLLGATSPASAHELVNNDRYQLTLDVSAMAGYFHSKESYDPFGLRAFPNGVTQPSKPLPEGSASWFEGYVKYGFHGSARVGSSHFYSKVNFESSGAFDDGDAAGFQTGHERRNSVEDLYVGWKSGDSIPWLGHNGLDISVGRQPIVIGNGFLIAGDALNLGRGIFNGAANRGGGYWLAAHQSFHNTAVLRVGGDSGWRGDVMWLQSDNAGQSSPELAIGNIEHVAPSGTWGATAIRSSHVNEASGVETFLGGGKLNPQRDNMKTYSLRYMGNAGIDNLHVAGEYAWQKQPNPEPHNANHENAWYGELGWQFAGLPWAPLVKYRYSEFSSQFDPLFYGDTSAALGTWFQGEVAGNYAGPFNTNTRVNTVEMDLFPSDKLFVGALLFHFNTRDRHAGPDTDANEADIYAAWTLNDHLTLVPLFGFYNPQKSAASGGTQIGNTRTNIYTQLFVVVNF